MKFDLFIATHNLKKRGYERLNWLLKSVELQTRPINRVWVCDGSHQTQAIPLRNICQNFPFVNYSWIQLPKMNKPQQINGQATLSDADYFIFSDVDYLFSSDLLESTAANAAQDRFLIKSVRTLRAEEQFSDQRIKDWNFQRIYYLPWPVEIACGGWQVHHRSFFEQSGGMDERMAGMSAMDEDYLKRAKIAGLEIIEVPYGQILHQWHPPSKGRHGTPDQQRNWQILKRVNYVNWRNNREK